MNGFGTGSDTVNISYPACSLGTICASLSPNQIQVVVSRPVGNTLTRFLGASASNTVGATAIAAVLSVVAPVPILVLHPSLSGALNGNNNSTIVITGGPSRSIQVNSTASDAYGAGSKTIGTINLSAAGPTGNGADFGVQGGPTTQPAGFSFGTLPGKYIQPASPLSDPLLFVCAPGDTTCLTSEGKPADPTISAAPAIVSLTTGSVPNYGCTNSNGCDLYSPGRYASGINYNGNKTAIFKPGVYVMGASNGFAVTANGTVQMCVVNTLANWPPVGTGCAADSVTGDGMLVYNEGGGNFALTGNGSAKLKGTPETDGSGNPSRFAGMLFFQDRSSPATGNKPHVLGGGGCIDLIGTIYTTNTLATMSAAGGANHYQELEYHGTPCSGTVRLGEIITDMLTFKGTPTLKMQLSSQSFVKIQQVALVGGGPHS